MTDMLVNDYTVTAALLGFIETQTGKRCGDATAPLVTGTSEPVAYPYYVLRQLDSSKFYGPSFVAPEADSCEMFMVATFGERADQVRLMRGKVRDAILGRVEGSGTFLNDIDIENHQIMQRSLGLKGKLNQQGTVFFVEDVYEFDVTSQI